jgi:TorA maturation chaperone TorD
MSKHNNQDVNPARSLYYGLLSQMLVFCEEKSRFSNVQEIIDILIQNPLDENSHEALKEIDEFFKHGGKEFIIQEYDDIFHNPSTSNIRTTASFYDEALESGKKTLEVRNFLAKTKIRRNEKKYKETEDSIGFLVTFMYELIELIIQGENSYENLQHCLYEEIINDFVDEFIVKLYEHDKSNVYKSLAVVFNAFIEFERLYFNVQKPKLNKTATKKESCEFISVEEEKRRAQNKLKKSAESIMDSCALEDDYFEDES